MSEAAIVECVRAVCTSLVVCCLIGAGTFIFFILNENKHN